MSVGGSIRNSPAVTASFAAADEGTAPASAEAPAGKEAGPHVLHMRMASEASSVFFMAVKRKGRTLLPGPNENDERRR